jgi:hypothetical protein
VSFSGLFGFEGDAFEASDKDRPLRGVRYNTALRAPPVWRVRVYQRLPEDEVALVLDHTSPRRRPRANTLCLLGSTYGKSEKIPTPLFYVGSVKIIRTSRGVIKAAELRESFARIRSVTKTRIPFFRPSTVAYREEENRQLEN